MFEMVGCSPWPNTVWVPCLAISALSAIASMMAVEVSSFADIGLCNRARRLTVRLGWLQCSLALHYAGAFGAVAVAANGEQGRRFMHLNRSKAKKVSLPILGIATLPVAGLPGEFQPYNDPPVTALSAAVL